jgi:IrrE N-terminal-like domain
MLACGNLREDLRGIASDLRPPGQSFVSVVKVAHELGVRVCVRLEKGCTRQTARIELAATTPTIYMTRHSLVDADRHLDLHEDHLLTPRERFSVAHELGHLIAFRQLQVPPARVKSEYWIQEECMHGFAAALLMPELMVDFRSYR